MGQQSSVARHGSRETDRLLPLGPDDIDHDGCFPPHSARDPCPANPYANLPVYTTIHRIRRDIIEAIDDPYSIEQLRDPRMNMSVVRPLVDKLYEANDVSMVYCLLVNRARFQREQLSQAHQQSVCATRAILCELLANRILRRFHEDNTGTRGLLLLAQILVGGFDPFQGAPAEIVEEGNHVPWTSHTRTGAKRKLPALEIAIISESKVFLSSSACQKVVNAIYEGRVIYTPTSFIDILPDHYKQKPISLYNPRKAPLLNQYRLIVPRTRSILEICQFVVLLALFLFVMVDRNPSTFGFFEGLFIIYTLGWVLDQFVSMLEHGWHVYTQNLWSFLDVTFSAVFAVYLVLRLYGWRTDEPEQGQQAMDVLAMGAPVLVPRLAFNLMSENMLFVSLRAMMKDFTVLTLLAVWCFAGFLLSMTWLSDGTHEPITISKWMLWVWFGLDGTGIQRSVDFHWLLGPILMVAFAFLGNTLFLTILVSMLSTTFSTIVANATAEIQFRRAVLTLEGVKSDAIFAYQPPFNLLALVVLLPLKFALTPRWFHKINVAAVRALNAPLLLLIAIIERRTLWSGTPRFRDVEQLPKSPVRPSLWRLSRGFSVHGDIQTVFDVEPPPSIEQEIANEDDLGHHSLENDFEREFGPEMGVKRTRTNTSKSRRDSVAPFAGITGRLRDLLIEGSEDGDGDITIKKRLEALEEATARIEGMLGRLCEELDDSSGKSDIVQGKETGTMDDLDVSGTADIDD
ncbi:uncharacterized protein LY89DRAFT_604478 [Mollisia scopiformis]|uniref:Nonselective cation channel n=1 Tax=Mollisia scopiformis TaxID=149040 RepID=A0A194XWI4_MOLSC|nr:uncharacterized protein LY89DRAFT_604478 [Mollisia scopiformis]KUJ24087.1 hypothetical protein LY89DRAFT_604478 [Mollisia scopiformis]